MTELGLTPLPQPAALAVRCVNRSLKVLNRWFMVPAHRLGLGPWIGTPIGGYILLLRVRGRSTGLIRETPLSYLIEDGSAWVLAGFGTKTQWYRNLLVNPEVEIWLPGRIVRCRAEEITDPAIRDPLLPRLVRATGVPGLLIGCNPWTAPDSKIVEMLRGIPLIRLTPLGEPLVAGPDDPGGQAWLWRQSVVAIGILLIARLVAGRRRPRLCAGQPAG
ncbi:MAG: nitroreductase/quinone reductase family protein [Chloroflexota bacterium]